IANSATVAHRTIGAAVERLNPAQAGAGDSTGGAEALTELRQTAIWVTQLYELRSEFNEAVRILNNVRQANSPDPVKSLRDQFDTVFGGVQSHLARLEQIPNVTADEKAALKAAAASLNTQATGNSGIFGLREQFLRTRSAIAAITTSLKNDGAQLREK